MQSILIAAKGRIKFSRADSGWIDKGNQKQKRDSGQEFTCNWKSLRARNPSRRKSTLPPDKRLSVLVQCDQRIFSDSLATGFVRFARGRDSKVRNTRITKTHSAKPRAPIRICLRPTAATVQVCRCPSGGHRRTKCCKRSFQQDACLEWSEAMSLRV